MVQPVAPDVRRVSRLAIGLGLCIVAIFGTAMVLLASTEDEPTRQYEPVTSVVRPPPEAAVVVKPDAAVPPPDASPGFAP
jgi:hypothetical protein